VKTSKRAVPAAPVTSTAPVTLTASVALIVLLALVVVLIAGTAVWSESDKALLVMADGIEIKFPDAVPYIDEQSRVQVPVRPICEAMGAKLDWDGSSKTVTVTKAETIVKLVIGSDIISINGMEKKMDTVAVLKNERTYLPVRFVSEALGADVKYWKQRSYSRYSTQSETNVVDIRLAEDENKLTRIENNSNNTIIFASLAECLEASRLAHETHGDDFKSVLQSVMLKNGKSLLETEPFYTTTGLSNNTCAYGDFENTVEYTIGSSDGKIFESFSIFINKNFSTVQLPNNINSDDSFAQVLNKLKLTEKVLNRDDERYFEIKNEDGTSTIGVSFLSYHAEPVDTELETAYATIFFSEAGKMADENGKTHIYHRYTSFVYREGKLENINMSWYGRYEILAEPEIENDRINIRFINPEYVGERYKIKLEEVCFKDGMFNVTYTVNANTETEITFMYDGWLSPDNGVISEKFTHTVLGEEKITNSFHEPYGNTDRDPSWKGLNENYLSLGISSSYVELSLTFFESDISIDRNTSW
jgi:hypothetical protein